MKAALSLFLDAVPNAKGIPHEKLGMRRALRVTGNSGAKLPSADAVFTAETTGRLSAARGPWPASGPR